MQAAAFSPKIPCYPLGFCEIAIHYPQEDELDELQAKTESVLNYIPLKRFTLCLPDANALLSPSEADEEKQWETVRLGMEMAARIFS